MKDHLKVVVYAIAHNEAKFAKRWMESMKEADEVVVLDTGSTDGTADLLRSLGAKVETKRYAEWATIADYKRIVAAKQETPWRFDWSRNDSIDLAKRLVPDADVLVCTDIDEVLLSGWRTKLEAAWLAYKRKNGVSPTTAQYEYAWNFKPDGSDGTKFLYEKVHTPTEGRWTHPVHEILHYEGQKRMVRVPGMRLEHHADPTKSRGQYLHLLELSVEEDPADDRNMHYLGREYMFYRRWDDCIKTLRRHLSLPRAQWRAERAASMRFIARCFGEKKDALRQEIWLRRAIAEEPGQREAALELAELMHAQKDWPALVRACEACLAVKERRLSYLTKPECWGFRPWDLYSIGLWYTGRREDAITANVEAMRLAPDDRRLKNNDAIMRRLMAGGSKADIIMKSVNPIVANAIAANRKTATRNAAAIVIKPSPSADTRSADHAVTMDELKASTEMHIDDVRRGLALLGRLLKKRGERHDWTKIQYLPSFYEQFSEAQKTGCWGNGWYDRIHCKQERHHIEDACPKDVNLLDILEHIVDGVMAGMARSGEYRQDVLGSGILERAYANTQCLVRNAVKVEAS